MPEDRSEPIYDVQMKLSLVPAKPGVYLFRDEHQKVLYVGKAKDLRNRLRSYFQKSSSLDARKAAMVKSVGDFEYTVTESELEAFVLEANLIKQYRPRYNVLLRDDKSYPYLKLTVGEKWPRLEVVRRIRKDGALYFGPYVPAGAMWEILSFIRTNFPIRTCGFQLDRKMRPCIQHQIKRCSAPCDGRIDHAQYMRMIEDIRMLLEGKNRRLIETLEKRMKILSGEMRYEEAAAVRDRLQAVRRVSEAQKVVAPELGDIDVAGAFREGDVATMKMLFIRNGIMIGSRHFHLGRLSGEPDGALMKNFLMQFYGREIIPPPEVLCTFPPEDSAVLADWLSERRGGAVRILIPKRGIKKRLLGMAEENAKIVAKAGLTEARTIMEELAVFLGLKKIPEDVGAFDISNISGKEPVGSFVYWADGGFIKDRYRHVRMEGVKGPDDYAMMKEMIRRTLRSLGGLPDLVIIDGGSAHLAAASEVFEESGISQSGLIAVAKDPDRVFLKGARTPLGIEGGSRPGLLLRRIRDEAHRFAVSYHKKLRSARAFESPLEKVPGVGRKRRFALLRHFGSIEAIRTAPVEEVAKVEGMNGKTAQAIHEALAKNNKENS